jgi:hypothetical protein
MIAGVLPINKGTLALVTFSGFAGIACGEARATQKRLKADSR